MHIQRIGFIFNPQVVIILCIAIFISVSDGSGDNPSTPQIIRQHGYYVESHTIDTEDGYFLELHRIPHSKARKPRRQRYPVLLCHGYMFSSFEWISGGPNRSLGYKLADEGYDVWMINFRGNMFSRGHVKYTPKQKQFWDFSVHEQGVYDLPATIDHILLMTGYPQLIVIGHSLGATTFYVTASTLHQYQNKIKAHISLAPLTANSHTKTLHMSPFTNYILNFLETYTAGSINEHDALNKFILQIATTVVFDGYSLFDQYLFSIYGSDPKQFNVSSSPLLASHFIDGASVKSTIHFMQFAIPGNSFANFDYGRQINIQKYGTPQPPNYNLSSINLPVRIYYGNNDLTVVPMDVENLYRTLPNGAGLIKVNDSLFSHIDFFGAIDINRLLNDDVIQFVHRLTDDTVSDLPASTNLANPPTPLSANTKEARSR